MCINFCGLIFRAFNWQENLWGINFCGHVGVVGIIIVGFAKYASYGGLIFVDRGISQNPQKFIYLENFYTHGSEGCVCGIYYKLTELQKLLLSCTYAQYFMIICTVHNVLMIMI